MKTFEKSIIRFRLKGKRFMKMEIIRISFMRVSFVYILIYTIFNYIFQLLFIHISIYNNILII